MSRWRLHLQKEEEACAATLHSAPAPHSCWLSRRPSCRGPSAAPRRPRGVGTHTPCPPARLLARFPDCLPAGPPARLLFEAHLLLLGGGGRWAGMDPQRPLLPGAAASLPGAVGGDGGGGAAAAASACPSGRCCFRGRLFVGVFCVFLVMEGGRWGLSLPLCCWVGGGGDGRGVGMTSGDGWRRGGGRRVYSRGCPTPQFDGGLSGTTSAEGFFFCLL